MPKDSSRLVARVLGACVSQDCVLCGAGGDAVVCAPCDAALMRIRAACVRCAAPLPSRGVCGRCRAQVPAFDDAAALFEYGFPLDRLVQRFKYGADFAVGRWLAHQLARGVAGEARPDVLVAPPSSRERLRERGFNQAVLLAKTVGERSGVPLATGGLVRTRATAPQPGLGRAERRRNLEGAFACRGDLRGAHVAIVDDVVTTGATADAIAATLKRAGAARVSVWAVARAPDPQTDD